ncbi:unnamed protein product [Ectocarpus sp. 6 AP-2014]
MNCPTLSEKECYYCSKHQGSAGLRGSHLFTFHPKPAAVVFQAKPSLCSSVRPAGYRRRKSQSDTTHTAVRRPPTHRPSLGSEIMAPLESFFVFLNRTWTDVFSSVKRIARSMLVVRARANTRQR